MQYISMQQLSVYADEQKKIGDSLVMFVAEDLPRMSEYQFIGVRMMIFVCRGTLDVYINSKLQTVVENDYADILDGTAVRFGKLSPDAEVYCIFTTKSFLLDAMKGVMPDPKGYLFRVIVDPVINLGPKEQCLNMRMQMKLLHNVVSDRTHKYREDMAKLYLKAFIFELSNVLYRLKVTSLVFHKISKREVLMVSFIDLVWKHLIETREVSFYARELCVTPKHLSRVVKDVSGKSPHEIIASETLALSIQLLQKNDMLVQQIADILHFSDQAAFSKFFKKYVGMSPAEYRRRYYETSTDS